jgi:hypothetical protein
MYQTWNINNQGNAEPSDRELQFLKYVQKTISLKNCITSYMLKNIVEKMY